MRFPTASLIVFALLPALPAAAAVGVPADSAALRPGVPAASVPAVPPADSAAVLNAYAFEGIWLFDAARSDDPARVLGARAPRVPRAAREGALRGTGGARGERAGRGAHAGPGDAPPGEEEDEEAVETGVTTDRTGGDPRRAMERVLRPPLKTVIYVDRDRFQLEEDEGSPRVYTIADSLQALGVRPLTGEATVRLAGRVLEASQPVGRRGALVETFELSADGSVLTIRARREGGSDGRPAVTVVRRYTRYEGD